MNTIYSIEIIKINILYLLSTTQYYDAVLVMIAWDK